MEYPMNTHYRWNPAEGIIGVVGVAPSATLDFYQRLIALTPVRKDWEHVRVLIDSNPKIPSRGRHLELGETDPSPFIRSCIDDLLARGATVVAVPCNTAHILYNRYATGVESYVPNMIALAVAAIAMGVNVPQRLAVLGSRQTILHNQYGDYLHAKGGTVMDTSPWQAEVSALIESTKQFGPSPEAASRLKRIMDQSANAGADAFIIACTELSALFSKNWIDIPVVDASDTLARYCLAQAKNTSSEMLT
jgi:aspartate racemase